MTTCKRCGKVISSGITQQRKPETIFSTHCSKCYDEISVDLDTKIQLTSGGKNGN